MLLYKQIHSSQNNLFLQRTNSEKTICIYHCIYLFIYSFTYTWNYWRIWNHNILLV